MSKKAAIHNFIYKTITHFHKPIGGSTEDEWRFRNGLPPLFIEFLKFIATERTANTLISINNENLRLMKKYLLIWKSVEPMVEVNLNVNTFTVYIWLC